MKTRVAAMAATIVFLGACDGNDVDVSADAATVSSADTCPKLLQGEWKATDVEVRTDADHSGSHSDLEQVAIKNMKLTFDANGKVAVSDVPPNRKPGMQANWNTLQTISCDTIEFLNGDFVVVYNATAMLKGESGKPHPHRLLGALAACKGSKKQMVLYILADKPPAPNTVGSIKLELPSPLCSSGASLQAIDLQPIVLRILTHGGRVHLQKQ